MIEIAIGHYPYPPETYANVFAQLTAIVHGDPPELPDQFSDVAKDFTSRCLQKNPQHRATYPELLVSDGFLSNPTRGGQQDYRDTNGLSKKQLGQWIWPDGSRRPWSGSDNNGTPIQRKPIEGERYVPRWHQSRHHTPTARFPFSFNDRRGLMLLNSAPRSLSEPLSIC